MICPYCHEESMVLCEKNGLTGYRAWYECPFCYSRSPYEDSADHICNFWREISEISDLGEGNDIVYLSPAGYSMTRSPEDTHFLIIPPCDSV